MQAGATGAAGVATGTMGEGTGVVALGLGSGLTAVAGEVTVGEAPLAGGEDTAG